MDPIDVMRARLDSCRSARGGLSGDLEIGGWTIRFSGLDPALAGVLGERWGEYWRPSGARPPSVSVAVVAGDGRAWIAPGPPGEPYRLEGRHDARGVIARSYAFALGEEAKGHWRLAVGTDEREPVGRTMDNAARYLVARLAAEAGGAALHGAVVLRGGSGWVFAGPSGSGKTTAVSLSAPGASLGDDFALIVPSVGGWAVPSSPFDNAERAPARPSLQAHPLAGILRLYHAPEPRIERPRGPVAIASLMACLAFPWALPDLAKQLDDTAEALVTSGRFAHLWFAREPSFWRLLESSGA